MLIQQRISNHFFIYYKLLQSLTGEGYQSLTAQFSKRMEKFGHKKRKMKKKLIRQSADKDFQRKMAIYKPEIFRVTTSRFWSFICDLAGMGFCEKERIENNNDK